MFRRNRNNSNNNHQRGANANDATFYRQTSHLIPAEVRLLSSCHTVQSSVDAAAAYDGGLPDPVNRAGGVATAAYLQILYAAAKLSPPPQQKESPTSTNLTFQQILLELRDRLKEQGYDQIPQLTSSRPLELQKTPFDLGGHRVGATKRALLVGINYHGQDGQLSGCHNDIHSVKHYLKTMQDFKEHNIVTLMDDGRHLKPSRHEIIRALQLLVKDSMPGDAVYVHYSGHGGLMPPEANDFKAKQKGYDETIYPLDHAYAGQIHDFSLYRHFVQPMRQDVIVTVIMDCCHCGGVLDLPYSFKPTSAGTIQMRENVDALANIAFLQVLMGNLLPSVGFENLVQQIENTTGIGLQDYQGIGLALEDQQGAASSDDGLGANSFDDLAVIEDESPDGNLDYYADGNESDSLGGRDCDCFGGGILSFILGLLGGGSNEGEEDDDVDF